MSLFADEPDLPEGITLRVYRFLVNEPKLSIIVRMVGPATEKAALVIAEYRKLMRKQKQQDLTTFDELHPTGIFKRLNAEETKKRALLKAYADGDTLMDLEAKQGEELLAKILSDFEALDLKVKKRDRRSNGELDEETILLT